MDKKARKQEIKKLAERKRREDLSKAYKNLMEALYNVGVLKEKKTSIANNKLLQEALNFVKSKPFESSYCNPGKTESKSNFTES